MTFYTKKTKVNKHSPRNQRTQKDCDTVSL